MEKIQVTEEVLEAVHQIGRWWTQNTDLLGYEIGNYQLRCLADGYWIVLDAQKYCPHIPKVLGYQFSGEFRTSNYNCGSQDDHIRFLKKFPIALTEKLCSNPCFSG